MRRPTLPAEQAEAAAERIWHSEHGRGQTSALPAIRERLTEHLRSLRTDSKRNTSALAKRIDKVQRDRYEWAENAMDGIVPADIAARSTRSWPVSSSNSNLSCGASKSRRDRHRRHPQPRHRPDQRPRPRLRRSRPVRRRTYNQAWFEHIYLDAVPDDPDAELTAGAERTVIADALEASRQLTVAELESESAGPEGPADVVLLNLSHTRGSIKSPLVDVKGLEPLTSRV